MNQKSRWADIFDHLRNEGFEVYSPSIKVGECLNEYLVIKNDGSSRRTGISTNEDFYSVMCFVPQKRYSDLEVLVQKVLVAMKKMEPMILPRGVQTSSFYDDDYNAFMVSIEYKNYKKMF